MPPIIEREYYLGEGLESFHNQEDLLSARFNNAYRAAVLSIGDDYQVPQRMRMLAWAGETAIRTNPELGFAELGTGKGYLMYFLLTYLKDEGLTPHCWLFDSFESDLSQKSKARGGISAGTKFYADSVEKVKSRFDSFGSCNVIEGHLPGSIDTVDIQGLGFVHVDLNDGFAEVESLRRLWPLIAPGSPIVLDDYANRGRSSQKTIVQKFFGELNLPILGTPQGQGLVIKC